MPHISRVLCLVCVTCSLFTHPSNAIAHQHPLATQAYEFTVIDLPLLIPFAGQLRPDVVRFTDLNASQTLIGTDFAGDGFVVTLPQTVVEIVCPGDTREDDNTTVVAINNGGDIVGDCTGTRDGVRADLAFLRTADGTLTLLQYPEADGTIATGINDVGEIVGVYWGMAFGTGLQRFHGFRWQHGLFTSIDAPFEGAMTTSLLGINNAGQVIGTYLHHRTGSPDINDADDRVTFLLDGDTWTVLAIPGVTAPCCEGTTWPMDLNNRGQILLSTTGNAQGDPAFFLYRQGVYTLMTGVPAPITDVDVAWGLNDRGTLAGSYLLRVPCATCGPEGTPGERFERHGFLARPVRHVHASPVGFVLQVWGDFNGDDSPDLAGVDDGNGIWECLAGEDACTQLPGAAISLVAGDYTRQGRDELVALASDYTMWRLREGDAWEPVPGLLARSLVSRKLQNGTAQLAAIAWDWRVWTSPALGQWRETNGYLRTLITGDFVGGRDQQVAGLGWDASIWYMPTMEAWQQVPGYLRTLQAIPGTPDAMQGLGFEGITWRAETLGAWHPVSMN
jgi:hypothetical protein